jgi:hypothetical protein
MNNGSVVGRGDFLTLKQRDDINLAEIVKEANSESRDNIDSETSIGIVPSLVGSLASISEMRKQSGVSGGSGMNELNDEKLEDLGEVTMSGSIGFGTYWKYLRIGSNLCLLSFILISNLLTQALYSGSDFWLQFWYLFFHAFF